jgi:phosphoesterase RecJ-like protein
MGISKICLNQITKSKNIAIIGHISPDADALGSMIALKRLIELNCENTKQKFNIDLFAENDGITDRYEPLLNGETLNNQTCDKYDLAISMDSARLARLGKYKDVFLSAKNSMNFDHHETNEKFAFYNITLANCSSTCELLYSLFCKDGTLKFTPDIACLLYSGIITDTNNLSQNIGKNTFNVISKLQTICAENNIDVSEIKNHFFKNNQPNQMKLLGRALASLSFAENGKIDMMTISQKDLKETNTTQQDIFGIVDHACTIKGVEIGALFIERKDGTYTVSLRSREEIDVGRIAKRLGGGGQKNMAAFETKANESLEDVKAKLLGACKEKLDTMKQKTNNVENFFSKSNFAKEYCKNFEK